MNHLLILLVPDKKATLLAIALSVVAFLLGLIDMLERNFDGARLHLNLSVGIMGCLFLLKYFSMRATYRIAENAQAQFRQRIKKIRRPPPPTSAETPHTEAEVRAQEKAEMTDLAANLKQALSNIEPNSPARQKYEATLELMERFLKNS